MARQWMIPIMVCLLVFSALSVAHGDTGTAHQKVIHILPDGTVTPPTAPIHRSGDFYQLTDNINTTIVIERNNITLDGRGFTIQGTGDYSNRQAAINLTCMGVTVENFQFKDWWVGVLGVYNGNRIVGNDFTDVSISIAVYADNYEITQNYLDYVRIVGSNIHVYNNEIQIPSLRSGCWISDSTDVKVEANNVITGKMITSFISVTGNGSIKVFHNNFFNADNVDFNKGQFYLFGMSGISNLDPWDDGLQSGGNYWSDYTARYSNASVTCSNVWNTPYLIQAGPCYSLVDRYPLLNPYPVEVAALPTAPPVGSIADKPTPSVPELPVMAMLVLLATLAIAVIGLKKKTKKRIEATSVESP
jgi:hypothetical protein